jgi:uncharacterized protein (DUF362 family)
MGIVSAWHMPSTADKDDIKAELGKMLAPFGGVGVFIMPGDKVLLKPDLANCGLAEEGLITDPQLVQAVIELAFESGAASVTVAESAAVGMDTCENFCLNGYDYLCEASGSLLCDLKDTATVLRTIPQALVIDQIKVYRDILLADVVINLPKLRLDEDGVFHGATANLLGMVADEEKERLQKGDLNRTLFDLANLLNPDLTIMDGGIIHERGQKRQLGMLLVGADIVAIDTIAASVLGISPANIEYLQLAEQYGLASAQPLNITIFGDDLSPLMKK